MVSVLAEFEKEIIRERVMSGLENARKMGRIGGRPTNLPSSVKDKILQKKTEGKPIREIGDVCSI